MITNLSGWPSGAFSIHSKAEGETFHPVVGPVAEAQALYVNQLKLRERVRAQAGEFVIWDVGLGAAANVLTALRATRGLSASCTSSVSTAPLRRCNLPCATRRNSVISRNTKAPSQELLQTGRADFKHGKQSVRWRLQPGRFPAIPAPATSHSRAARNYV